MTDVVPKLNQQVTEALRDLLKTDSDSFLSLIENADEMTVTMPSNTTLELVLSKHGHSTTVSIKVTEHKG